MLLLRSRVKSGIWSLLASPRTIFKASAFSLASCPCRKKCCLRGFFWRTSGPSHPHRQTGCANHFAVIAALSRRLAQAARMASDRGVAGRFSDFSLVVVIPPLKYPEISRHKILGHTGVPIKPSACHPARPGRSATARLVFLNLRCEIGIQQGASLPLKPPTLLTFPRHSLPIGSWQSPNRGVASPIARPGGTLEQW
jgi:hypothetical protein